LYVSNARSDLGNQNRIGLFHKAMDTASYNSASNTTTKSTATNKNELILWFYGGYVILILIVGSAQNMLTLVIFVMDKRLHLFHNFYIVGLAVADVGMGLSGNWMIIVSAFHGSWYFGHPGMSFCPTLHYNYVLFV